MTLLTFNRYMKYDVGTRNDQTVYTQSLHIPIESLAIVVVLCSPLVHALH